MTKPMNPQARVEPKSQGLCDTTSTERFENKDCTCPTYVGNLGPCKSFDEGGNGRCVYCDHELSCHLAIGKQHFETVIKPEVAPTEHVAALSKPAIAEEQSNEDLRRSLSVAHNLINDWHDLDYGKRAVEAQDIIVEVIESLMALSKPDVAAETEALRLSTRQQFWNEARPIINAIGEISVQEAMDAIEKHLGVRRV